MHQARDWMAAQDTVLSNRSGDAAMSAFEWDLATGLGNPTSAASLPG